mmetsp:Transcript_11304/g.27151  ORF Transcript_11304/g.27151 Transcript_11304/m.27151 type:complete len:111 (-) Transcript_11304:366-698(-)
MTFQLNQLSAVCLKINPNHRSHRKACTILGSIMRVSKPQFHEEWLEERSSGNLSLSCKLRPHVSDILRYNGLPTLYLLTQSGERMWSDRFAFWSGPDAGISNPSSMPSTE